MPVPLVTALLLVCRHVFAFMFLLAALLFVSLTSQAQVTNVSDVEATPLPGAGHNYTGILNETVNPQNGSLSVRIEVPMPAGRKLTVPFAFAYDSNGAIQLLNLENQGPKMPYLFSTGWTYTAPVMNSQETNQTGTFEGDPVHCLFYSGYVFNDPQGTRHSFPTMLNVTGGTNSECTDLGTISSLSGSDAWLAAQATAGGPGVVTIQDADGTTYHFSQIGLASSVEDRNGNEITYADSGNGVFTLTDTAGRTAISSNGFGATGNTVTVSGLGNPYNLTWGATATWNYNIGETLVYTPTGYTCGMVPFNTPDGSHPILSVLTLPNSESYKFYYDPTYGVLNEIVYPTGGWVKYAWGINAQSEMATGGATTPTGLQNHCFYRFGEPVIIERQVSYDGSTVAEEQDYTYSTTWSGSSGTFAAASWTNKNTTVVTKDKVRGQSFQTLYTYGSVSIPAPAGMIAAVGTQVPVESIIAYYDWSGSLLKTVNKAWINQYLMKSEETVWANSQTSEASYTYGSLGVLTGKAEYDYGQGTIGSLTRSTTTKYQSFPSNPLGSTVYDRPCQTIVYDGNSNRYSETDDYYDNGSTSTVCGTAGTPSVTAVSGLTGHDETNFGPTSTSPRGNVTTIVKQCFEGGQTCASGNPTTTYTYDETGQALSMIDPRNNTAQYSYSDSYTSGTPPGTTNAYPTKFTYPTTGGVAHVENFSYGYADGQLTQGKDENSQITTYKYNDPLDRPTETDYPDGGVTTLTYNDTPPTPSVTTSKKLNSAQTDTSVSVMDGLGHVTQTQLTSDPISTVYTVKAYDGTGQVYTATNPYRSAGDQTYGTTTFSHDALNRATSVVDTDGSSSTVTTQYCGASILVTDEASHWRRSRTDGLGRLVEVDEPNSTTATVNVCPGTGEPIWVTSYTYDPLDDLLGVVQGSSRSRSFVYDSLKRLTSSTNPEAGTVGYTYDANNNVTSKTDARSITTNYSPSGSPIDALNRVTEMTYSDGTPTVTDAYDQATCIGQSPCYNVGRRTTMTDGGGTENLSYDSMGREWGEQRITNSVTKTTAYTYDLAGDLLTLTYPSGRTITYSYNSVAQPISAVDIANSINYASSAVYAPQGAVAQVEYGSNLTSTFIYNKRLQPCWLYATTGSALATTTLCTASDPGPGNILDLQYGFNLGSGDNGNVISIANNRNSTRSQTFTYDQVNRIVTAQTSATTGPNCWGESYTMDQWANMTAIGAVSGYSGCTQEGLSVAATTSNQLSAAGFSYDPSGNMLADAVNTYGWNAESEIKSAAAVNYTYDGDGNRLEKSSGKIYWYGAGSEILDESDLSGNFTNEYVFFSGKRIALRNVSSGTIYYYAEDTLGSSRTLVQAGQTSVCYDADFYPFGGERDITVSCSQNYKFEGKERDTETGNDDFGARYYASRLGRWLSADWSAVPTPVPYANLKNPQTLNLYAMVRDNPETFADIDGHCYPLCTVVIGAALGAVAGALAETGGEVLKGEHLSRGKIAKAAGAGAITGAITGLAGPEAGVAAKLALSVAGSVIGGAAERASSGEKVADIKAVSGDAVAGVFGSVVESQAGRSMASTAVRKLTSAVIETGTDTGRRASESQPQHHQEQQQQQQRQQGNQQPNPAQQPQSAPGALRQANDAHP
jgi:RHS repeat-associated protein